MLDICFCSVSEYSVVELKNITFSLFFRVFNDRFYLSFFVAPHGFRVNDFDYYSIAYLSAHKSRPSVSMCVY